MSSLSSAAFERPISWLILGHLVSIFRWWDTRTLSKTAEMTFADPITSMERANSSLGEILTVTAGKDVYFIDAER